MNSTEKLPSKIGIEGFKASQFRALGVQVSYSGTKSGGSSRDDAGTAITKGNAPGRAATGVPHTEHKPRATSFSLDPE